MDDVDEVFKNINIVTEFDIQDSSTFGSIKVKERADVEVLEIAGINSIPLYSAYRGQ